MFSMFHPTSSQISINVSTTTFTTTAEVGRLPLALTLSSDSEGTMRTASSKLEEEEGEEEEGEEHKGGKGAPGLGGEDHPSRATYPFFPAHPFRNPRHARSVSTANAPPPIQLFTLSTDPCPFPNPPSPPLARRVSSPSLHDDDQVKAQQMTLSARFRFARLLHLLPSASKKRSKKEARKSEGPTGYHYLRVQQRLQEERKLVGGGEKSPSALWNSEGYW